MRIAITGGTGLVGSRILEISAKKYDFLTLDRSLGFDITEKSSLDKVADDDFDLVLHLAAYTNVDRAEEDRELGEKSVAWKLNVTGTKNIVSFCQKTNKKIIYVSTEFVFDGVNPPAGGYTEENMPNPINWYGMTKYEGEKLVQNSGLSFLIVRLASPYRAYFAEKKDFMRAMKTRLEKGEEIKAVTDHLFTPTFIDDFTYALDTLISQNVEGIYHVVGSDYLTPYNAGLKIADVFDLDQNLIKKSTREEYFKGKAKRGYNWSVKNDKIKKLGIRMRTFQEGLEEIKKQVLRSKY